MRRCPHCGKAVSLVDRIRTDFAGKRVTFRHVVSRYRVKLGTAGFAFSFLVRNGFAERRAQGVYEVFL